MDKKKEAGTNKNGADIMLLFCPLLFTTEPHLATAHLKAFLKSRNHNIVSCDFNIEFLRMFKNRDFLDYIADLLERKFYRLKYPGITKENYPDYIKVNNALAAVKSLQKDRETPLDMSQWSNFSLRVFTIQAALGFDTMIQNDFIEYFDDYMSYQGIKEFPRDRRLIPWRRSTIAETVTKEKLYNPQENLFLPVFKYCLLENIRERNPKIIGLSVSTNEQIIQALSIARMIKENFPEIHLTAGGSYFSYLEKKHITQLMDLNVLDSLIRFEGEIPLDSLIKTLLKQGKLTEVPNLIYKNKDNKLIINPIASPLSIESLPAPDYDNTASLMENNRALSLYASRGCYWGKCAYCTYTTGQKRFFIKSAERVVKELKELNEKYGVKCFNLISESIAPAYARKISEGILKEKLELELSIWARTEAGFDKELCSLMKKAGFNLVTLGVENLNDKILKAMKKGTTVQNSINVIRNMSEAGILIQVNIIVGFPGETYEDAMHTYSIIENELKNISIFRLVVGPFAVLRGSEIYRTPGEFGIKIKAEKNDSFQPKSIFAAFDYIKKDNSFLNIVEIAKLYHKNLSLPSNYSTPYTNFSGLAEQRCLDYKIENNRITRSPCYLTIDFSTGTTYLNDLPANNLKMPPPPMPNHSINI